MKSEPVVTASVVTGLISAFLVMLISLDVFTLTEGQQTAIMSFVALAVPVVLSFWPRSQVTPVTEPRIETADGEKIRLVREDTHQPVAGDRGKV